MQINKKKICRLVTATALVTSMLSVAAAAEDKPKYPTLTQAPEIIFAEERGYDNCTLVDVSWKNTREFNEMLADYKFDEKSLPQGMDLRISQSKAMYRLHTR